VGENSKKERVPAMSKGLMREWRFETYSVCVCVCVRVFLFGSVRCGHIESMTLCSNDYLPLSSFPYFILFLLFAFSFLIFHFSRPNY
jgi:hypothetical protein